MDANNIEILLVKKRPICLSRKGNSYDNACIESFHAVIKKELIFHETYKTREQAKRSIFRYLVSFTSVALV